MGQRPCPIRPTPPSPRSSTSWPTSTSSTARSSTASLAYRNAAKSVREAPRVGRGHDARGQGHRAARHRQDARGEDRRRCSTRARSRRSRSCAAKFPPGLVDMTRLPGPRAQARAQALRRARASTRSRRCARRPRPSSCATCAASGAKFEEAVLAALRGRRRRGARARGCCSTRRWTIGEGIVEALRAHPAVRPRRARRLGAAPGRRGQGPRHHRHRLRPAGAAGRLRRARRHRELGVARRERRAGAHPHRPVASTCASSSPTSSATCCSTSPAPRRTTWRCARRRCAAGCTSREYGILDDATGETHRCATEEEVYALLGLPWIPPELRENRGELALTDGELPVLIEQGDLKGDLHMHTIAQRRARRRRGRWRCARASCGLEYIAITDHSATPRLRQPRHARRAARADRARPRARRAHRRHPRARSAPRRTSAPTARPTTTTTCSPQLDWVVGSVHTSFAHRRATR